MYDEIWLKLYEITISRAMYDEIWLKLYKITISRAMYDEIWLNYIRLQSHVQCMMRYG